MPLLGVLHGADPTELPEYVSFSKQFLQVSAVLHKTTKPAQQGHVSATQACSSHRNKKLISLVEVIKLLLTSFISNKTFLFGRGVRLGTLPNELMPTLNLT